MDFSGVLGEVLIKLEEKKCDTVVFSLWSIIQPFSVRKQLTGMNPRHIRAVLYEEFALDTSKKNKFPEKRGSGRFVVCYRKNGAWHEYKFSGVFGSLSPGKEDKDEAKAAGRKVEDWMRAKANCLVDQIPARTMGDCCVLICGESNIVRRRLEGNKVEVHDELQVKSKMPKSLRIVLNPGHDRMGPRMNLKREFLSKAPGRWVLCVWNKGKKDKNGKERDGKKPAWMAFRDGKQVTETIEPLKNAPNGLEVGVVDCR
jgi:hypothetical protein